MPQNFCFVIENNNLKRHLLSFSNKNDEPETHRFIIHFQKTKTKQKHIDFAVNFKNGDQYYMKHTSTTNLGYRNVSLL